MRLSLHLVSRLFLVASLDFVALPSAAQTQAALSQSEPRLLLDGKEVSLQNAIQQRLICPLQVARDHLEGWVYVSFKIDTDGLVKDARIAQKLDDFCDGAALVAVSKLPLLEPAMQEGKLVATYRTIPVKFSWRTPPPRVK